MRHINIPIFIPHLGCPNNCVFCNQRSISGHIDFDISSVCGEIEEVLSGAREGDLYEIAFFGGSFTGIDRALMTELLDIAESYVSAGKVESIRLSTRPDYIDNEILDILSHYSVRTIELGLQSMCDDVLLASRRGHSAERAREASRLIKSRGFSLVGQMMVGLPESTIESEIYTANKLCELGVDAVRIYPTVVFYDTELCHMAECGAYTPIDNDIAVERTKELIKIFDKNSVECIRVGLCASENLSSEQAVFGGANHSAIGELAMGEVYFDKMCELIEKSPSVKGKKVTFYVKNGAVSKAVGQKKKNIKRIYKKYSPLGVKVLEKNEILGYNIMIDII